MAQQINLLEQNQWEASPNEELKIPEAYITQLRYEIIVFGRKKEFTFRCANYEPTEAGAWKFSGVILDTSTRNPRGEITLKRLTYYPELVLVNVPFMVIQAPEATPTASDAQT